MIASTPFWNHHLGRIFGAIIFIVTAGSARAELPAADTGPIITFQIENDVLNNTDRNYTSGFRLGWTSPNADVKGEPYLPRFLSDLGTYVWGEGRQRISIDVSSAIFTPTNIHAATPDPRDRPYAGVIMANAFLLHDTTTTRSLLGLSLGILGPSARGEDIQNGFHDLIADPEANGWRHQIKDMPIVQIFAGRTWRYDLLSYPSAGVGVDILPAVTGGVGTMRDFAQFSAQIRLGQGLDSDFGTTRVRPGLSGSDAYTPTLPFVWYVFAGADGQGILRDATLDGNPFASGPHVGHQWFVGEFEAGLAIIYRGVRLTATHVAQTSTFHGQRGGFFQFDSFAASMRF